MAKVTYVKKSRKEQVCQKCRKAIPVGSEYSWVSFNFGPTIIRCKECGFKPYETTANEYGQNAGRIAYEFEENLRNCNDIESLESAKDDVLSELEGLRDELEDKKYNLPEQFQESGPGEIITQRIDNLEDVISEVENVDFDYDDPADVEDIEEIKQTLIDSGDWVEPNSDLEGFDHEVEDEDEIRQVYEDYCNEKLDERVDEIRDALSDALSSLEY